MQLGRYRGELHVIRRRSTLVRCSCRKGHGPCLSSSASRGSMYLSLASDFGFALSHSDYYFLASSSCSARRPFLSDV